MTNFVPLCLTLYQQVKFLKVGTGVLDIDLNDLISCLQVGNDLSNLKAYGLHGETSNNFKGPNSYFSKVGHSDITNDPCHKISCEQALTDMSDIHAQG